MVTHVEALRLSCRRRRQQLLLRDFRVLNGVAFRSNLLDDFQSLGERLPKGKGQAACVAFRKHIKQTVCVFGGRLRDQVELNADVGCLVGVRVNDTLLVNGEGLHVKALWVEGGRGSEQPHLHVVIVSAAHTRPLRGAHCAHLTKWFRDVKDGLWSVVGHFLAAATAAAALLVRHEGRRQNTRPRNQEKKVWCETREKKLKIIRILKIIK